MKTEQEKSVELVDIVLKMAWLSILIQKILISIVKKELKLFLQFTHKIVLLKLAFGGELKFKFVFFLGLGKIDNSLGKLVIVEFE